MRWPEMPKNICRLEWTATSPNRCGQVSFVPRLTGWQDPHTRRLGGPSRKRKGKSTCPMQSLIRLNCWRASKMTANLYAIFCSYSKRNFPDISRPCAMPWIPRMEKGSRLRRTPKGMLSNLAAHPAAVAAARLEQLGRNREVSEFRGAYASFENISKELLLHLDTCMAEVCR